VNRSGELVYLLHQNVITLLLFPPRTNSNIKGGGRLRQNLLEQNLQKHTLFLALFKAFLPLLSP